MEWRLGRGIRERAFQIEGGQGQTEACVTGDMLRSDLMSPHRPYVTVALGDGLGGFYCCFLC